MRFAIQKTKNETWNVIPTSGALEGVPVAEVEGVNLKGVSFVGRTIIGSIKALWGATILIEDVYADHDMLRSLALGGKFDMSPEEVLWTDFDGWHDTVNHVVRTAKAVVAIGPATYAKGAI